MPCTTLIDPGVLDATKNAEMSRASPSFSLKFGIVAVVE